MIEIAVPNESFWEENKEEKHSVDAEKGWYRYYVRFGLPIYNDITGELERYNIYSATMLIRHSSDGKKYLYDFTAIKKKQAARLSNKYCTVKTHFLFIRVISKAVFVKQKLELNI